ncbi:MAG: HAMP domain-containing histidine kinase [Ignavibacteriae bacterium]|nr:HAMP domain-containing histidine kinase [Ignavibacteriota bacterium]MCB9208315.1 HAMP domain-containing histidine kinase [Ignavibacteriales bacterium]
MIKKIIHLLKKTTLFLIGNHVPKAIQNGTDISNLEISRKLVMLRYILGMVYIFSISFGILSIYQEHILTAIMDFGIVMVVTIIIFVFKKYHKINFLFYSLIILAAIVFQILLFTGGTDYSGPLWSYLFPITSMFLFGRQQGRIFSIAYLVITILIDFSGFAPVIYTQNFKLRFLGSYSAVAILSYYIEFVREAVNNKLRTKNLELLNSLVELEKAKEKAEKSDLLKSNFLAQMSHEIRTPIYTIMNYTYLLRSEFKGIASDSTTANFNAIEKAAHRLQRTIDLILNLSDLESGSYEPNFTKIEIQKLIELNIQSFHPIAKEKKIELNYISNVKESAAKLDEYTFNHIFINLVDNAIKYTENGKVEVLFAENGKNYNLIIADSGIGIGKEYLPYLFDKFSQEEMGYTRRFDGNGLGLAIVKKYCDINSIKIDVESEKNKGTKISLKIPKMESN